MSGSMKSIRGMLADGLEKPENFGGESWSAAQQMIGNLAGISLDGLSPEAALAEYPWLPKFLRSDAATYDASGEDDDERAARELAAEAREQRLAPLHEANERRSAVVYQVAEELGIPADGDLTLAYADPRVVALDAEIEGVKGRVFGTAPSE